VRVLVVEDDQGLCELLAEELGEQGHDVRALTDGANALHDLRRWTPELVLSDLRLPGADGLAILRASRELPVPPAFILITAFGTIAQAVEALHEGADDFLTKPLDFDHLRLSIARTLETHALRDEVQRFRAWVGPDEDFHGLMGRSAPMQALVTTIRRIATTDSPVLIVGESGSGKELVARALHGESNRSRGPFVAVNCAGMPGELLESELFGHVAGAFTGASGSRRGLFAAASGGTLFLDEIGEMPLAFQAKLLRVLQDGRVRPVGADRESSFDVRIVAATNRDLEADQRAGRFRSDLYYRLETFTLRVPPLRERGDDLDLLAARFVAALAGNTGRSVEAITPAAIRQLRRYPFPGNVRELRNAMERAVAFATDGKVRPEHLPERIRRYGRAQRPDRPEDRISLWDREERMPTLEELERRYIHYVLDRVDGNKRRAASVLGIGRRTLYRRLGIEEG
jgi:DNA-binding NtrC family response regulator